MAILRSLPVAAVTLAVLTLSSAAPQSLLMRQTSSEDVSAVLGNTFSLVGKVGSASCADSIVFQKQSAFAESNLGKLVAAFEGPDAAILSSFTEALSIVLYPDISVNGNACSGDGEVSLTVPSTLPALGAALAQLAPSLEALGGTGGAVFASLGNAAGALVEFTRQFGVAVGSDLAPGECNGVKLPAGYAWVNDLAAAIPMVASAAGIRDPKKGDLYLITVAGIPENPANLISGTEPLCVFKLGGSSPDSRASAGAKYRPSPVASTRGSRGPHGKSNRHRPCS